MVWYWTKRKKNPSRLAAILPENGVQTKKSSSKQTKKKPICASWHRLAGSHEAINVAGGDCVMTGRSTYSLPSLVMNRLVMVMTAHTNIGRRSTFRR